MFTSKTLLAGIVALALASVTVAAQDVKKMVVVEPYLGLGLPTKAVEGTDPFTGLDSGAEARYNLKNGKLSLGLDYNWSVAARTRGDKMSSERAVSLSATCDYYLRRGKVTAFFVGTGLGVAHRNTVRSAAAPGIGICPLHGPVASPRIGMELWGHVRLTIEARLTQKHYNTVAFRIGVPIGVSRWK